MNPADLLDHALERSGAPDVAPASVRNLIAVAAEVADAISATRLSHADQQRIYERSLAMLEEALHDHRRGWQRALRIQPRGPALMGGVAALSIGAAAIGWAVIHARRGLRRTAA